MNEMTPNYTADLARLLVFAGETAMAIRMYSVYSVYSGGSPSNYLGKAPDARRESIDLMFLADALHHFERVGHAIERERPLEIVEACDYTARIFSDYS